MSPKRSIVYARMKLVILYGPEEVSGLEIPLEKGDIFKLVSDSLRLLEPFGLRTSRTVYWLLIEA